MIRRGSSPSINLSTAISPTNRNGRDSDLDAFGEEDVEFMRLWTIGPGD